MNIRAEVDLDHTAIREINKAAFGTDMEADLVDRLRMEEHMRLSLVAEIGDVLIGHIFLVR